MSELTCDCHLHEYQVCDICQGVVRQADPTALGSDGIAPEGALQAGDGRDALELAGALHRNLIDLMDVCLKDEQPILAREFHLMAHGVGMFMEQWRRQEPRSGDTDGAEQREAGLTQKFEAQARKVVEQCMRSDAFREVWNEGDTDLLEIISSALSTSYEEGKAAECERREYAEEELECIRMFLDKHNVPKEIDGVPLSYVGRIMCYAPIAHRENTNA
jgi:hypothetical protein